MAIIPLNNETVKMQPNAPVAAVSTSDARIEGEAIARFGQSIQNFGERALKVKRTLDREEGTNAIQDTYRQAHLYAEQNSMEDGSDYEKNVQEFAQPRIQEIRSKYGGDPLLGAELDVYSRGAEAESTTTAKIKSFERLENSNRRRLDSMGDQDADNVRENPNSNLFGAKIKNMGSTVDQLVSTGAISAPKAEELKQKYKEKVGIGYLNGLATTEQYQRGLNFLQANTEAKDRSGNPIVTEIDPDQAKGLGFIDSKQAEALKAKGESYKVPILTKGKVRLSPEESIVAASIDPATKDRMIDWFNNKMKEKNTTNLSDLHQSISGYNDLVLSGKEVDPRVIQSIENDLYKAHKAGQITDTALARTIDGLQATTAVGQRLRVLDMTPAKDFDNVIKNVEYDIDSQGRLAGFDASLDPAMESNRARTVGVIPDHIRSILKERNDDGAKFVLSRDEKLQTLYKGTLDGNVAGTQKYVQAVIAKQKYLGIPDDKIRVLTKDQAVALTQQFNATTDAGAKNQLLAEKQAQYGSYLPKVMVEIGKVDKQVAKLQIATFAPVETRMQLIDAITNEKKIKEEFDAKFATNSEMKSNAVKVAVEGAVGPLTRVYTTTSDNSQGMGFMDTVREAVTLQVKRDAIRDDEPDMQKLAKDAYDRVIGSQFNIVTSDKSSLLVPKRIDNQPVDAELVQSYLDVFTKPENMDILHPFVPKNFENHKEAYYEGLSSTAKWVMNQTGTGTRLMAVPPGETRYMPVPDTKGRPIERSFRQLNKELSDEEAVKVKDEMKGVTGRMFEKAGKFMSEVIGTTIENAGNANGKLPDGIKNKGPK